MNDLTIIPMLIAGVILLIVALRMLRIFIEGRTIEYIQSDWLEVLPYRVRHNRYRGVNRPAYTLVCLMYYSIKSLFLLYFAIGFHLFKLVLWDIWKWIFKFKKRTWYRRLLIAFHLETRDEEVEESEDEDNEETDGPECADDIEEIPFCQLFDIGPHMCLLVDHVEMCPDETAFIRVVDDEGYTPLYKRKVRRDKQGNRFISFNGKNHYLNKKKTKPTVTKKQ